jgi:signal transduction histidine kinase
MRTKLFFAFLLIIFLAFVSNVVFERLIIGDFNDFLKGTEEDHIYWVMASVEGSFKEGAWDEVLLSEAFHWGLMLGFDAYIEDSGGEEVLSSSEVISSMNPNMLSRMRSLLKLPSGKGEFTWYPLYVEGKEVGKLYIRKLERIGLIPLKEEVFRKRGREFLVISFLIAGGGALFLAVLLTIFISSPIRRLTMAAERIAGGEFSLKEPVISKTWFLPYRDEIDRMTETFNYMAEALKREDALRKHLTSNVAHELRTPLTIIRGNLEAIEDGVISDPQTVIKNIHSEIQRLIDLVEGIEDMTRAEASFFKRGSLEEINVKDFVESVSSDLQKLIEEKGLYFKTIGPSCVVKTYPEKFRIVLKNLLTNAYKFTDEGGITVRWDRPRREALSSFSIAVEDTGRGIPEDQRSEIFERFFKAKDSSGRGLGLAIVKELTEVMGGKIEFDSTVKKGSRFLLTF